MLQNYYLIYPNFVGFLSLIVLAVLVVSNIIQLHYSLHVIRRKIFDILGYDQTEPRFGERDTPRSPPWHKHYVGFILSGVPLLLVIYISFLFIAAGCTVIIEAVKRLVA